MSKEHPRHVRRFPVPGEPGAWVELRRMTIGEQRALRQGDTASEDKVAAALVEVIMAWSWPWPIDVAGLDNLDFPTLSWLYDTSAAHNNGTLPDDEKKDATSGLTASSPASQVSTPTSPSTP